LSDERPHGRFLDSEQFARLLVVESLDARQDHRLALTRRECEKQTNRALAFGDLLEGVGTGASRCERSLGCELGSAIEASVAVQRRPEEIPRQIRFVIEPVPALEELEERCLSDVFSLLLASREQDESLE